MIRTASYSMYLSTKSPHTRQRVKRRLPALYCLYKSSFSAMHSTHNAGRAPVIPLPRSSGDDDFGDARTGRCGPITPSPVEINKDCFLCTFVPASPSACPVPRLAVRFRQFSPGCITTVLHVRIQKKTGLMLMEREGGRSLCARTRCREGMTAAAQSIHLAHTAKHCLDGDGRTEKM